MNEQANIWEEELVWLIAQSPSITQSIVGAGGRQCNGSELGRGTDQKTRVNSRNQLDFFFFFPFYSVGMTSP